MAIVLDFRTISEGATRVVKINCTRELSDTEILVGTPVVTERTTTDLTITEKVVSPIIETVEGNAVAIGKCIRFALLGAKADYAYVIDVSCYTSSSPTAEKLTYEGTLNCI